MATQQTPKTRPDPGQEEYERNFDFERHERELANTPSGGPDNPAEQANMDRAKAWSPDDRPLGEQEAAPSWNTNLNNGGAAAQGSGGGNAISNLMKQKATKWIIGGAISAIFAIGAAVPMVLSGALAQLGKLTDGWANDNNYSYYSKRTQRNLQKKLFQADENCDSGVKCKRYGQGVSDKEIEKMKATGLNPEVKETGNKKYKYIVSLNTTDAEGKTARITSDNFGEHYSNNVRFRAQMDNIAKPKSMFMRGKATLKIVFDKFGIKRNRTISGDDDKERNKNFRADIYGQGNDAEKANSPPDGSTEDEVEQIQGIDDSISEAAQQERDRLTATGFDRPPSIVPDVTNLDLDPGSAVGVGNSALKEGAKSAWKGAFAAIDKACSGYQFIRAAVFGAKIYKILGLVKYAGVYMTIYDKMRAGDSFATEVAFFAGILFRPSTKKDSYGKTFFQSEGYNLVSQGKIADKRGLARFTTGTPFLKFLQGSQKTLESAGANKETCKHVASWYGQAALIVAGLALDIGSGGWAIVAGAAAGAGIGMLVSVIISYITPMLIQYAAGTVAPDPTDPEGGYGAGNAIVAGMGAFGHFAGSANGERVLTTADAAAVQMESNKEMAFMDKVDNYGKSPFSIDSSTSITSQLALAVAPIASAPFSQSAFQNLASIVTSPFSLFSSSFGNIVTRGVNAQSNIDMGGEFCADEDYKALGLAVTAFCTPIDGEKESTIMDAKYDPETVLNYMLANDHIDPETGDAKSDDFKKYISSCTDSITPISPDGGGSDVGEDIDTRWCIDTRDKFNNFRFYTSDSSININYDDSVNDTLGLDSNSSATGNLTGTTYPNGKIPDGVLCDLGSQWPGQKLRCDAKDAFTKLAEAYQAHFGSPIQMSGSYRDYDAQVSMHQSNPGGSATPGHSNHGCGQAVDFSGMSQFGTPNYNWMKDNAGAYGWIHPAWAEPGGSKPEPWHWEFGTNGQSNSGTCQT